MPYNKLCGGIIADEVGLGKTRVLLSTVLATPYQSCAFCESYDAAGKSKKRPSRATLGIAPSAANLVRNAL